MKHFFLLQMVFVLLGTNSPAQTTELAPEQRDPYNILLAGQYNLSCLLRSACGYSDGFIPEGDVERVLMELGAIRNIAPEVAKIHDSGQVDLRMILVYDLAGLLPASLSAEQRKAMFHRMALNPLDTGIRGLDELNKQFGATKIDDFDTDRSLVLHFSKPLDIAHVAEIYRKQLGNHFEPNSIYHVGDVPRIERIQKAGQPLHYVFTIGSGSCFGGCSEHVYYHFNLYPQPKGFRVEKVPDSPADRLRGPLMPDSPDVKIPAKAADLRNVSGVAIDPAGSVILTSTVFNAVFRVDSSGLLTIVAGNGTRGFGGDNGPATSAWLGDPGAVAVDSAGNLYIADLSDRIRKVSNGVITTVAGNGTRGFSGDNGPATSASLSHPSGLAVDSAGNLYIADTGNGRIRKVSNGVITTVAGNGTWPVLDGAGNLYIADSGNGGIRKVSNGVITTGDNGPATSAQVYPEGVAVHGSTLYIADIGRNRVIKISDGIMTIVAGNGKEGFSGDDGPATSAELSFPRAIAVDAAGTLYIADVKNSRIRSVSNGVITTVAGNGIAGFSGDNGPAKSAQLGAPSGITVDSSGNLYIADANVNRIRRVSKGVITTVAGNGTERKQ